MKFVNGTLCDRRCRGDESHHPYGRKTEKSSPPPAPVPPPFNPNRNLQELLKVMKPESKDVFESKMLKASRILPVSEIKKETEDILAILRNLHKK
jgi:hypothetical protein